MLSSFVQGWLKAFRGRGVDRRRRPARQANAATLTLEYLESRLAPAALFLDNSSPSGFSTTGAWTEETNGGYLSNYLTAGAGTGSKTAAWAFSSLSPGQYRVSATWVASSNRASNAPFAVFDGSIPIGTATLSEQLAPNNLADGGANWEDLGYFNETSGSLSVTLTNAGNGYAVADAIRIQLVGALPSNPTALLLDGAQPVTPGTGSVSFGDTPTGVPVTQMFTVMNQGSSALTLSALKVPAGYSVTSAFGSTSLAAGATTTFSVQLNAAAGSYSGVVSFTTNDPNNTTLPFNVSGTVSPGLVEDNSSATGFSTVGTWVNGSNGGYLGNYLYVAGGNGSHTASWSFSSLDPGRYRVSATWLPYSNRATNAPFSVFDGTAQLATVSLNQQVAPDSLTDVGAAWQDLGIFTDASGSLSVTLSNAANGYVVADAIRIERVGDVPPVIVVSDTAGVVANGTGSVTFGSTPFGNTVTLTVANEGPAALTLGSITAPAGFTVTSGFGSTTLAQGNSTTFTVQLTGIAAGPYSGVLSFGTNDPNNTTFQIRVSGTIAAAIVANNSGSGFTTVGTWTSYKGGYLGSYLAYNAGDGTKTATWAFNSIAPGQYRISATWVPFSNRATNAPFTVHDGTNAIGTVALNEQLTPGSFTDVGVGWQDLGVFDITNTSMSVSLSNLANGFVIADGIRIQRVGDLPPYIVVSTATGAVPAGTGTVSFGSIPNGTTLTQTLTVVNKGQMPLTLGLISVPTGFSLASGFGGTTLAAGASTTFAIELNEPPGSYSGVVSFSTNDPNNPTFQFNLSGTVSAALVEDNSEAGFSTAGTWANYSNGGFLGNYEAASAGTGTRTATWTFDNLTPGVYRISATWLPYSNRASNAPFTVFDGNSPIGTVTLNQQLAPNTLTDVGASWQDVGTFSITNTSLSVVLTNAANGYVIADAIRILRTGNLTPVLAVSDSTGALINGTGSVAYGETALGRTITQTFTVANNGLAPLTLGTINVPTGFSLASNFGSTTVAPGASTTFGVQLNASAGSYSGVVSFTSNDPNNTTFAFHVSGTVSSGAVVDNSSSTGFSANIPWAQYTGSGYLNNYLAYNPGTGAATASWSFTGVNPGQYQVAVTWVAFTNRASNAPFSVFDGGSLLSTVAVNEQLAPSSFTDLGVGWMSLGNFNVTSGNLSVMLSNAANGFVIADAIRIQYVGELPPILAVSNAGTAVANGTGSLSFGEISLGTTLTQILTVTNNGQMPLTLGTITVPTGFTLSSNFGSTTLAPGASTTFAVQLNATAGSYSGVVSFTSNDPHNATFSFNVSGSVSTGTVLDNSSPTGFSTNIPWAQYMDGGYLNNYLSYDPGSGSATATWAFTGLAPGRYQVSATWFAFTNRASNAPFSIFDGSSLLSTVAVNEQLAPSSFTDLGVGWSNLGNFNVTTGNLSVMLTNAANGFVIADAIRVQYLGALTG